MRRFRGFRASEDGYVAILALIGMPFLLGLSLFVIDGNRAINLHTDLQHAADAMALAAGRELNGDADAITRANSALTKVHNQARFGDSGPAVISENDVVVLYFESIPLNDDTPMDPNDALNPNDPAAGTLANYVWVRTKLRAMTTLFPLPVGLDKDTLSISADAVATYAEAACDQTPLFICNPFESADPVSNESFVDAFAEGKTYSREFRALKTSGTPGPGNFGLLDTREDNVDLVDAFARGVGSVCTSRKEVQTKTGVTYGKVNVGLNVRFDVYAGSAGTAIHRSDEGYRPASNVRRGAKWPINCKKVETEDNTTQAMGFPPGSAGSYPDQTGVSGDYWDRNGYWSVNHNGASMPNIPSSSSPTSSSLPPSRYDVYKYEIAQSLVGDAAPNRETGIPKTTGTCYGGPGGSITNEPDRRVIFAAIVNCRDFSDPTKHTTISGKTSLKPDAFASFFLTNPVEKVDKNAQDDDINAAEKPIRMEVIDVTGDRGNGTLDTFFRQESFLVR